MFLILKNIILVFISLLFFTLEGMSSDRFQKLYQEKKNSCVMIITKSKEGKVLSKGSGFVVNSKGVIATCWHVLEDTFSELDKIIIVFDGGKKSLVSGVVWYDADLDVAFLKVAAPYPISFVSTSSTKELLPRMPIFSITSPENKFNEFSKGSFVYVNVQDSFRENIAMDLKINHGSSGGAVFDFYGNVFGIAATISKRYSGAIPYEMIPEGAADIPPVPLQNFIKKMRGGPYERLLQKAKAIGVANMKPVKIYSKAIELNPQRSKAYMKRGLIYFKMKKYKKAERDMSMAIKLDNFPSQAFYQRGLIYVKMEKYEQAFKDFTSATLLDPRFANAHFMRGNIGARIGKKQDAETSYTRFIEMNPDIVNGYLARRSFRFSIGDVLGANDDQKKIWGISPPFRLSEGDSEPIFFEKLK